MLPRAVYEDLSRREDGWQIIERMQSRAEDTRRFEGVPHLAVLFSETIQLMIEKGLPVPAELLRAAELAEARTEPRMETESVLIARVLHSDDRAAFGELVRLPCFEHGLSHEEAAAALQCPLGTLKSHIARGKSRLRMLLEKSHG